MYQFVEIFFLVNPVKRKSARAVSVRHHSIVSAHYAGKKTKAYQPCTVFMLQAFIIDQRNFFLNDRLQKFLIVSLQFSCVGEKKIRLSGNKHIHRNLFYSE